MIRLCFSIMAIAVLVAACGRFGRDDVGAGAALFAANCAVCHGGNAQGGGGGGVFGLSKTPPDLTILRFRNGGTYPVSDTVETLEGYAGGGLAGRQNLALFALQSSRKKRVRLEGTRVRTSEPLADILVFLGSIQQP